MKVSCGIHSYAGLAGLEQEPAFELNLSEPNNIPKVRTCQGSDLLIASNRGKELTQGLDNNFENVVDFFLNRFQAVEQNVAMCGMFGVLELLKQSGPGQLQ